jgi:hypothetical protein
VDERLLVVAVDLHQKLFSQPKKITNFPSKNTSTCGETEASIESVRVGDSAASFNECVEVQKWPFSRIVVILDVSSQSEMFPKMIDESEIGAMLGRWLRGSRTPTRVACGWRNKEYSEGKLLSDDRIAQELATAEFALCKSSKKE